MVFHLFSSLPCPRQTLSAVHTQGLTLLQVLQSHPDIRVGATKARNCAKFLLVFIFLVFRVRGFFYTEQIKLEIMEKKFCLPLASAA